MVQHSSAREVISAQTDRTGFLHLPNEIRNRIYEEALFQHDREVVFLPRKMPRKVLDDGFKICDAFMDAENRSQRTQILLHEIGFVELITDVHEECKWVAEERPPEETPLPVFTEEETDDEIEVYNVPGRSNNRWRDAWIRTREVCLDREQDIKGADVCGDCNLVYCTCIGEIPLSEEEVNDAVIEAQERGGNGDSQSDDVSDDQYGNEDDEGEGGEAYDADGYLIPPTSCLKGHGEMGATNIQCSFCGGFGLGSDEDEEAYVNDDSDHEDPLEEDDEHFDSEERIGMLFYTWEPGILLACKEIRKQCLPLYYGSNAFSWRLFWGDQTRSLARFTEWTRVVGRNAKYITQVSFEGRHSIEEGIEFEVDIDLLEESPFFDIAAECSTPRR